MDLLEVKADEAKELDGAWIDLDEKTRVLVAAEKNQRYLEELDRVVAKYRRGFKGKTMPKDLALRLITEIEAKTLLLGWEGMEEHGKALTYSQETAARVLRDYPRFRDRILALAGDFDWFRYVEEKIEEQIEGN